LPNESEQHRIFSATAPNQMHCLAIRSPSIFRFPQLHGRTQSKPSKSNPPISLQRLSDV
jgi:hypothetical protein